MSCAPEDVRNYDKELLKITNTHIAPAMPVHPRTKDAYAAYNKPLAVIDWLASTTPEEEWIIVLDSDMLIRKALDQAYFDSYNLTQGWAVGSRYMYMKGVRNELALRHIPEVIPHNDTLAGPPGRRGDMVGCFLYIHRDDLKRLAKDWLKFTEDVREDPEAWRLSGDSYAIHPGDKPWISEMYGYVFAAAKANVWHKWDKNSMIYPGNTPVGIPRVMHYGLLIEVGAYQFDKHWFYAFDAMQCPPWDLDNSRPTAGIFPPPPHPTSHTSRDIITRYTDLLSTEVVATINAGLCDWHRRRCPDTQQLNTVCNGVDRLLEDIRAALVEVEAKWGCLDHYKACAGWASSGECSKNPGFMTEHCMLSCKVCKPTPPKQQHSAAVAAAGASTNTSLGAGVGSLDSRDGTLGATAASTAQQAADAAQRARAAATSPQLPGDHQPGGGDAAQRQQATAAVRPPVTAAPQPSISDNSAEAAAHAAASTEGKQSPSPAAVAANRDKQREGASSEDAIQDSRASGQEAVAAAAQSDTDYVKGPKLGPDTAAAGQGTAVAGGQDEDGAAAAAAAIAAASASQLHDDFEDPRFFSDSRAVVSAQLDDAPQRVTLKDRLHRCYVMEGLSAKEIKACAAAARLGHEYKHVEVLPPAVQAVNAQNKDHLQDGAVMEIEGGGPLITADKAVGNNTGEHRAKVERAAEPSPARGSGRALAIVLWIAFVAAFLAMLSRAFTRRRAARMNVRAD